MQEAVAGQSSLLKIGAISTAVFDLLPGLIDRLTREYPRLTVSVRGALSGALGSLIPGLLTRVPS